jgi:hypothetical protein
MQPLHPLDAISPAFARTRQTILTPFKAGRAWKLCACSYLAFAGSIFIPFPLVLLLLPRGLGASAYPILAFAILLQFAVYLGIFYCGNRMAFVEFELLVTRAKLVAPIWNRSGSRTWPYMSLKIAWGTLVTLASVPLLIVRGKALFLNLPAQMAQPAPGAQPDPTVFFHFFGAIMGLYAIILAIFFIIKFFDSLLNDFVLPFYAMEDVPLLTAVARGWEVVRREPGQVALYLLLKLALALGGYIALAMATVVLEIPLILIVGIVFALGLGIAHVLPGPAGHLLNIVGGIILFLLIYIVFIAIIIALAGYMLSLLEAYAIYFLGGRYQKLGDYLQPPSYTYAPPPLPPSPDEDEDDGPPLPMNPALA